MTSHGSQAYGVGMHHPDQRLLPAAGLGLPPPGADDLQVPVTLNPNDLLRVGFPYSDTSGPLQCVQTGRNKSDIVKTFLKSPEPINGRYGSLQQPFSLSIIIFHLVFS